MPFVIGQERNGFVTAVTYFPDNTAPEMYRDDLRLWYPRSVGRKVEGRSTHMASKAMKKDDLQTVTAPDVQPDRDGAAIAVRAYELWQERGCPDGSDWTDWFKAESELKRSMIQRPTAV